MNENNPKRTGQTYTVDSQGNIVKSRRVDDEETTKNSDSQNGQQNFAVLKYSEDYFKRGMSLSSLSSTSIDTLEDADDLIKELDDMLLSTSKFITKRTTGKKLQKKTSTLSTVEKKNIDEDSESAENNNIDSINKRARKVSNAEIDIETSKRGNKEIPEDNSRTNTTDAHNIAEHITDADYGFQSYKTCLSSTSIDTLNDADDLIKELDDMLPSTSKLITKQTTSDNHVEKTSTLRTTEKKNVHEDSENAENTEIDSVKKRTRKVSIADTDMENTTRDNDIPEDNSGTNVMDDHNVAENIIGTAYGSPTCEADSRFFLIEQHTPIVCIKNDILDKKVKNSEAVDLTQILKSVRNDVHLKDDAVCVKDNGNKNVKKNIKEVPVVISIPTDITVSSGNQDVVQTLPGEVISDSCKNKRVIITRQTEIDNDDIGETRKKKRNMKTLKELFCGCFWRKRKTKVKSVCYGVSQTEGKYEEFDEKEKVVYDKMEAIEYDKFLHFQSFGNN